MAALKSFPAESDDGNTEYKLHLKEPDEAKFERLVTQLQHRMTEGDGECIYEIGIMDDGSLQGITKTEMEQSVATLHRMAAQLNYCVYPVSTLELSDGRLIQELIVREDSTTNYQNVTIAILGSVDCAKSTLLGVLVSVKVNSDGELDSDSLDDGRGKCRVKIANHPHEISTGRTSSQSLHIVGFDSKGTLINSGGDHVRKR